MGNTIREPLRTPRNTGLLSAVATKCAIMDLLGQYLVRLNNRSTIVGLLVFSNQEPQGPSQNTIPRVLCQWSVLFQSLSFSSSTSAYASAK